MYKKKWTVIMTAVLIGLTGCSAANTNKASISVQSAGLSGASENRYSHTSGYAGNLTQIQHSTLMKAIEMAAPIHHNTYLSMNRDVADQLMKLTHLSTTTVAMTDTNIYVAVDMGGKADMRKNAQVKHVSQTNDPAMEAGFFRSGGLSAEMDWVSAKSIPSESSSTIRQQLSRIYPDANIYISSNPLFVNRMMYYDLQQRDNKHMDTYLNEFNAMVAYAFHASR